MENPHKLNHISPKDIDQLNPQELVQILDYLLKSEVFRHGLEVEDQYVPTVKITTPDEGEDGRIIFNGNATKWLPKNRCYFQSKASSLSAKQCANEITSGEELKSKVKEVINNDGCYVLFMGYDVGAKKNIESREDEIDQRVKAILDKIEDHDIAIEPDQIKVYDSKYISDWVNEHISVVKLVDRFCGRLKADSFLPWQHFVERYHETIFQSQFYWTEKLKEQKGTLFKQLKNDQSARVIGYSGIGKTRFVGECFRGSSDEKKNIFNAAFVYINFSNTDEEEIYSFLMNHKKYAGVLVIDNCPKEFHDQFSSHVKRKCKYLNLVTIDNELESIQDSIVLEKRSQEDVCKQILSPIKKQFSKKEFEEILNICEGYPYFANIILEHIREESTDSISLELEKNEFKNGIIKRLIAGSGRHPHFESSDLFKVAKGISVFKRLPFVDSEYEDLDGIDTADFRRKVEVVINHVLNTDITVDKFYDIAQNKLKNQRQLIERRGLQYSIRPEILAINLAADWLDRFPPLNKDKLIQELTESGLIEQFCERLKSLDQIERSKVLIEKYWGKNRPFVQAEVLNSDLGSRLFRSVVEVNPEACMAGLESTLSQFNTRELKEDFKEGRRNIVLSLEKLAFRNETFERAAFLLAKLSVGENETYSNNSTGQFLQLFHIYLAGTEADYERRIGVINVLKNKKEAGFKELVLKAISSGLASGNFTRSGNAAKQGTQILQDYEPENYDEIYKYWGELVKVWCEIFDSEDNLRLEALDQIKSNLNSLVNNNLWNLLEQIIKRAENLKEEFVWTEGIQSLKRIISFGKISDKDEKKLKNFIQRLEPIDNFERLIELRVIEAPHEQKKVTEGGRETFIDIALENLKKFTKRFIESDETPIDYYSQLLSGNPRLAFNFGIQLGEEIEEKTAKRYIEAGLDYLKGLKEDDRNSDFLGGLFKNIADEIQLKIIDKSIERELYKEALYFTAVKEPNKEDLEKLLHLSQNGLLPVEEYIRFQYGMQLEHLGLDKIVWLGNELGKINPIGYPVALSILFHHSNQGKDLQNLLLKNVKEWLTAVNFNKLNYQLTQTDDYQWSQITCHILSREDEDGEFAKKILRQLIEVSKEETSHTYNLYQEKVFGCLFKNNFDDVWNILGNEILKGEGAFKLLLTLKAKNGTDIDHGILFSNITSSEKRKIIDWCKDHPEKGAKRIAYMMPCINQEEDGNGEIYYKWSKFALEMIDIFGDDESFLKEVSANLGGVSWVGNIAVYYERIKNMIDQIKDHPKIEVRKWAKDKSKSLQKDIKRENMRHEEIYGSRND